MPTPPGYDSDKAGSALFSIYFHAHMLAHLGPTRAARRGITGSPDASGKTEEMASAAWVGATRPRPLGAADSRHDVPAMEKQNAAAKPHARRIVRIVAVQGLLIQLIPEAAVKQPNCAAGSRVPRD